MYSEHCIIPNLENDTEGDARGMSQSYLRFMQRSADITNSYHMMFNNTHFLLIFFLFVGAPMQVHSMHSPECDTAPVEQLLPSRVSYNLKG